MSAQQCPLCFAPLETREVAPCMDCGHDPQELQHFAEGRHTYAEYRIFGSLSLILCNFCQVDFGSYDPSISDCPRPPVSVSSACPSSATWILHSAFSTRSALSAIAA